MPRKKKEVAQNDGRKSRPPAMTPEGRENQLISLAVDLAEKQLLNGTASAQVITHYLKLGTTKEKLEKEKLEAENNLLRAKADNLYSQKNTEELYKHAIQAMRIYVGVEEEFEDEEV